MGDMYNRTLILVQGLATIKFVQDYHCDKSFSKKEIYLNMCLLIVILHTDLSMHRI